MCSKSEAGELLKFLFSIYNICDPKMDPKHYTAKKKFVYFP